MHSTIASWLGDIDSRLVSSRQQEPLPAVILALEDERPSEPEEPAQDESEPEETREGSGQALAVGAERELEDEQEEQPEEEERVERLLRPALDEQVLPDHDEGPPHERQGASSACRV